LPRPPIAYVEIRFFAHATEDPDKVLKAVRNLLPIEHVDEIEFKRINLRGHYGNPILLFEAKMRRKAAEALLERLSAGLGELDKASLGQEVERHLSGSSLFLRLDKQAAFYGEFKLCNADPIHLRFRFRRGKVEEVARFCREAGLLG